MATETEIKTVMIGGDRLLLALDFLKLLGQSCGGHQPSVWAEGSRVVRKKLGINLDDSLILSHALYDNGARILHETLQSGGDAVGAITFDATPFVEHAIDWRIVQDRREATTAVIAAIIRAFASGELTEKDFRKRE